MKIDGDDPVYRDRMRSAAYDEGEAARLKLVRETEHLERDRQGVIDGGDTMTLRDRFAGQAMGAMICHDTPIADCDPDYIAVCAYNFADAMIKERSTMG